MLSGPLLEDQLAFRVAADLRREHTSSRIGDVYGGADPNRDNYGVLRIKLRGEPTSVPGLQLGATYSHSRVDMPQTVGVLAPFPSRIDPTPGYGVFATNVDSLTLVARQRLSENLVSTTTVSGGDAFVQRFARPGLGETRTDSEDVSLESVLDWSRGPVQLVGGMHLLRSWSSHDINLSAVLGNGQFDDRQGSLGLFSELQVRLWTRLLVTTGIRYQQDVQRRVGAIDGTPVAVSVDFDEAYRAWLPRVSVAFETTPTSRIGVLVQRASNPGGTYFNFDAAEQGQFGPETLWNYELFARLSLADGRVSISANAFLAEGHDSQRAQSFGYAIPGGGTAFWAAIWNVPRTRIHGLETQMSWAVRPRLSLQGSLGLLGTRIVGTASQTDPLLGREFARAPAFTAAAALEWRPAEQWRISLSAHHNGGYFSDDANTAALRIAGTSVVDAQVDYQHGPWSLFAYARNAFDRFYMLSLSSPQRGTAGDPAQYGVGLEWRRVAR
jgi:iron complex outermembrane receptor protein